MSHFLTALLLLTSLSAANADELQGRVVAIADGDTLTILDAQNQQHKIRLAGIDAPEKNQPFGQVSRQHLAKQCFQQAASVVWNKRDRYQRIIGKVYCKGKEVGLDQIQAGLAWWYRKYAKDQTQEDQGRYSDAEIAASRDKRGLWQSPKPTPPWDWRRKGRGLNGLHEPISTNHNPILG